LSENQKQLAMGIIQELQWRGLIKDMTPGTEEFLEKNKVTLYLGIDPTADSMHVGHLAALIVMKHFKNYGHKPIIVIGGATGMVGDPSGKDEERPLLDEQVLKHNQEALKKQVAKFLDFDEDKDNGAIMVNNYDWTKDYTFLGFLRDIGKHITVNYMLAKESVKKRMEKGISFTEFSYQLLQGFDFLYLYEHYNCKMQIGGSDQWGNITTGIELIRRKLGKEDAYALVIPLITRADGKKFGKSEKGMNVWLDPTKTSPYQFYQFWINTADVDAENYIKVFTFLSKEQIDEIIAKHKEAPHLRLLQRTLADEMTRLVHGEDQLRKAIEASQILFGKGTKQTLAQLDEQTFLDVFDGVPTFELDKNELQKGINVVDLLADKTKVFSSKSEVRRLIKEGGLNINQEKVTSQDRNVDTSDLLNNKYILIRKGKKKYFIIVAK
jgi:tyrosyl-tRNA synthetase